MTDDEYAAQKARVERYTERWLIPLGLDHWHLACCWHREKEDPEERPRGALRPSMMSTEVRWQYQDATLHVYLPSVREVEDDHRLEAIVVHEYLHVLLHELRPQCACEDDHLAHEEHAATVLARAFLRVAHAYKGGTDGHPEDPEPEGAQAVHLPWLVPDLGVGQTLPPVRTLPGRDPGHPLAPDP